MLLPVIIAFIILAALGLGLRSRRSDELIVHRPYNNRYNDASGAREDHLG
jgi:hypothetical protein